MRKYISYLYPITRKVKSKYNDTLEITWHNGKKHLNTKNANYSYGSLQVILKFGLDKIDLKHINSILLLGLGGGSVIETLRQDFNYKKQITAIDIDPVIIDIAKTEYLLESNSNTTIICEDALQFIKENTTKYELIIIDLFIDIKVPKQFLELSFWEDVIKSKSTNGVILFNASLEEKKSHQLQSVINFLKTKVYKVDVYENVNNTNTILISQSL
ncbi:fused MFS/spermidine synthase [Psychroserpens ponticola]|uniref:Fused MFS/spermidine synthase n=1 Tax=Psychroserpens ponticola TaxID=2932268 RepID=A0ABY7RYC5_9FLAO|nr:fused MFS/spermidine synthase [Psychroserpens ponticola]WCO01858.1 fused MFS/spermidine synthase [Psychroserpens ponticola]